ncbi:MAG TPA: glycosyltransferase family 2 protein [Stellaceae bacterium]|nr:glycosyltransferase family 2 protein [Stellaceae bacterium]
MTAPPADPAILSPSAALPAADLAPPGPELCVVVPTFNEAGNVVVLVERLAEVLAGIDWEVVFVDDDSPDGTAARVRALGRADRRVRCIRRIGRRGLSSASIEGMLSTSAPFIAVMDGDLQHDEALLPQMLARLRDGSSDLAIASRYVGAGDPGGLASEGRRRLSRAGARLARLLIRNEVSDPVSGFFMLRRDTTEEIAPRLSGVGTKILIDIMASAPRPLSIVELPYRFRARHSGESKLDSVTALEYLLLLAEKSGGRYFSHRLIMFLLVGATGVGVNLGVLRLLLALGVRFTASDAAGTIVAMISNFFLNNVFTYRDSRLVGWRAVRGLVTFMALCGIGALVNVAVARNLYQATGLWWLAGIAGAVVGALLNYGLTSIFTWGRRP